MSGEPKYPVAIIADDETVVVHASFDSVVRDIEELDFSGVILIDSFGVAFSLQAVEESGWQDRMLTALGTPRRSLVVPRASPLPPEIIELAKVALSR